MKTLLFSPPKYNGSFITVNDCCWGTGEVQVLQDRLLRIGSYLENQGDDVSFLDAGMYNFTWVSVFNQLRRIRPDRVIFRVVPQFESWQMTIANMCDILDMEPMCIGITEGYENILLGDYLVTPLSESDLDIPSWDKMPPINFELLRSPFGIYEFNPVMQISEGCPYSCSFCPWSKKDFKMLPVDVLFENLKGYNSDVSIYLLCAQVTTNKKWLEKFVERKKEFKLDFEWTTDINAREITEDKIELLKESNCTKVMMGIESTNPEILDKVNKKMTIGEIENAILLCKKYGLKLTCSFLYNIDPSEDVENDIRFYKQFKFFTPSPGIMKIYPGTPIYDETRQFDYIHQMGTNPVQTSVGLDDAIKRLLKWKSVLNGKA